MMEKSECWPGEENLIHAGKTVLEMKNGGILVVKKGENGVIAFHPEGMISMPSFPTSNLVDPTGCGDSFAGSMAHYLSKNSGYNQRGIGRISHTCNCYSLIHYREILALKNKKTQC